MGTVKSKQLKPAVVRMRAEAPDVRSLIVMQDIVRHSLSPNGMKPGTG